MAENTIRTSPNASIPENMQILEQRLAQVEERFSEMGYAVVGLVKSEIKSDWKVPAQQETIYGMHTAICIDTIDPWKQGRVRYFSPLQHMQEAAVKSLPWAYPISNQGGFDDCGCTWVPPAGSKLCLIFEAGNRQWPYYLGTTWDRDRTGGWNYPVPEYEKIHRGHRGGYLVGKDEIQVFPPWNTENYNGYDIDSISEFENDPEARNKITYPNIYGWKTPQKHMIKMVDGNYKCNFRWQRLEIKSSQGNHLIFKDDRVHPSAQWAHPDCGCGSGDLSKCNEGDEPIEKVENCPTQAQGDNTPVAPTVMMIGSGKANEQVSQSGSAAGQCSNPYFKHRSECRPYSGPGNPQNNKVDKTTLPQSGIQMTSISGHTFWMDDAVKEPRGKNNWEKGIQPFDYGCDEVFKGKSVWKSAHGHQMMMSDVEPDGTPKGRNAENFIRILTATGNRFEMNDDTKGKSCRAGPRRGIELHSTSNHMIQMVDENNDQCNLNRREGGVPMNKATDAFIRIRTGYGLEMMMADDHSQRNCQTQYIQITAPQKGQDDAEGACCGPHFIRMQESINCGYIFVRAGGDYICMTEGDHITVVGVGETTPKDDFCKGGCLGPRNWFTAVSKHSVHWSCNFYFNKSEIAAFLADKIILLMAGKDCPPPPGGTECGPCVGPVAVLLGDPKSKVGRLVASDRVFASASQEAPCISIFNLSPYTKCGGVNCEPSAYTSGFKSNRFGRLYEE
ncbi:hypothetical protein EBT16_00315 [bacterium]|nr:hypothetical protein [bacterium]